MRIIEASWYDYPHYYDLAFRSETRREADFIEAACRKYCPFPTRRLLEPGCGSGRLVVELVRRGYEVTAFDDNDRALAYLKRKLKTYWGWNVSRGELASFGVRETQEVDAAFCTMNTFRHLLTEDTAGGHLQCVAKSLRPGGIYILGFHLLPLDVSEEDCERWTAVASSTRVTTTLRVLHTDRRRRIETIRVSLRVRTGAKDLRIRSEFPLRMYTAAQFRSLLRYVPELELCDVYDFWYEIDQPLKLDDRITDTVFVLRKRAVE